MKNVPKIKRLGNVRWPWPSWPFKKSTKKATKTCTNSQKKYIKNTNNTKKC